MGSRPSLEQAVLNNIKIARLLIRGRHSVEADTELNEAIPRIRVALMAQAQEGEVYGLTTADLERLIYPERN